MIISRLCRLCSLHYPTQLCMVVPVWGAWIEMSFRNFRTHYIGGRVSVVSVDTSTGYNSVVDTVISDMSDRTTHTPREGNRVRVCDFFRLFLVGVFALLCSFFGVGLSPFLVLFGVGFVQFLTRVFCHFWPFFIPFKAYPPHVSFLALSF